MGHPQEEAQNELREAVARVALLLRKEHHRQDYRQEVHLPLHLRPHDAAWHRPGRVLRLDRSDAVQLRRRRRRTSASRTLATSVSLVSTKSKTDVIIFDLSETKIDFCTKNIISKPIFESFLRKLSTRLPQANCFAAKLS